MNQYQEYIAFAKSLLMVASGRQAKEFSDNTTREEKSLIMGECYKCKHRETVPGNCHIKCAKPDADMTGNPHGIREGWFMYPLLFDPTWKTKKCDNFEDVDAVNQSVSHSVSRAV